MQSQPSPPSQRRQMISQLLMGGIIPVVAFTVIEEYYGVVWGVIAGMVFGVGEIIYEYRTNKKVSPVTWGSNALVLGLGAVSLISQDGIWFKLQPALLEIIVTLFLWGSLFFKKSLFEMISEKQGKTIDPALLPHFRGMTFRLGIFFLIQSILATWAAFKWTVTEWALLKGVGLTVSLFIYMFLEVFYLRWKRSRASE